jgi:hypothetical protein
LLTFETNNSDNESETNPIKIKPNKNNKAKVKKRGASQLKIKEKKLSKPKQTWFNLFATCEILDSS